MLSHGKARLRLVSWLMPAAAVGLLAMAPAALTERLSGSTVWWRRAAFGTTGLRILALLVSCCALWWLTMRLAARLCGRERHRIGRGQQGTAIIEFALLFPVATLLFLVIIQTALMYTANFYVNFAAYRAARAAIVWGHTDQLVPDPRHTLAIGPLAEQRIRNAAIMTCVGISGLTTSGQSSGEGSEFESTCRRFVGRPISWGGDRLQKRYAYAHEHTRVRIETMPRPDPLLSDWNAAHQDFYRTREPISVEVSHDFELMIPYAKWLLGQNTTGVNSPGGDFRSIELKASYTLISEGQPELTPGMPAEPVDG